MHLGVSSYTWTWAVGIQGYEPGNPVDALGLLEKAKSNNVNVLQIADNPALHEIQKEELQKIAERADEYGITLETGTRGIDPEHLMKYFDIAKLLKSNIVRTITHEVGADAVARIKDVLPDFESSGIFLALENHDEHTTHELAGFLDKIGSPFVGVCLDTVNSFAALESPETVVKTLARYTLNLHVKDFAIVRAGHQLGFSIEGRPAGEGRLDIPWTLETLRVEGKDPNVILELWTPFSGDVEETIRREDEWAVKSLRYLRSVLK